MVSDYLGQLARFVTDTRLEDLDASAVSTAKDVVLDTIGAILAGSRLEENVNFAHLARGMSNGGPASVSGGTLSRAAVHRCGNFQEGGQLSPDLREAWRHAGCALCLTPLSEAARAAGSQPPSST